MLEATNGSIFIDGEDISKLHLNVLRTNLTILPQVKYKTLNNLGYYLNTNKPCLCEVV
jgi:ABC-type transport system involved in Fe-S cluster assembly fused permease/ATPase subunit